ncbi:MAG: transketolase C-terminal domain-containing protein [Eubacteriales bacterium]|nr:transketolase C-terminal domain-containing protein [Eubacteriales bacterium]
MSELIATRVAYGEALAKLGAENDKIVVLDADLAHATMTAKFMEKFPERFFNAGIAEANMVDMAAGLSTMDLVPFCSTFAVFAGRAYDQIRNGVCYPHFNVKFGMTHAGITLGEDGGSHEAIEDIALMRVLPGMTILSPSDANQVYKAVKAASEYDGPVYIRLGRLPSPVLPEQPFEIGKANVLREGTDAVIIATGIVVCNALEAAEELLKEGKSVAVVNMHTIKPIDREIIEKYVASSHKIFTLEEHSVIGGLGDAVMDVINGRKPITKIGVEDRFGQSGKPAALLDEYGLSTEKIVARIKAEI